ncbi:MAG: hypothetical protein Q9181_000677 [Wetmoreana brouardii]
MGRQGNGELCDCDKEARELHDDVSEKILSTDEAVDKKRRRTALTVEDEHMEELDFALGYILVTAARPSFAYPRGIAKSSPDILKSSASNKAEVDEG